MYKLIKPLFMICETPMHVGSGADLGIVDLPIQREKHTGFPKIESSSLKGALREAIESAAVKRISDSGKNEALENLVKINKIFGWDEDPVDERFSKTDLLPHFTIYQNGREEEEISFAGAIGFTDARLLLFPVKSVKGVFAWVCCWKNLLQFEKDMQLALGNDFSIPGLHNGSVDKNSTHLLSENNSLSFKGHVILEDYSFPVESILQQKIQVTHGGIKMPLGEWLAKHVCPSEDTYWLEKMKHDIVILSDSDFTDFVQLSTEVITRTKIDNVLGTVAPGALFTEEYLPAESVLYSLVLAHDEFTKADEKITAEGVLKFFGNNLAGHAQIGANATLGKGILKMGKHFFANNNL